jgi:hypothetical protein
VPGYLNFTLASNQNNNGATTVSQGSTAPSGGANLYPNQDIEGMGLTEQSSTTQFVADKNVVSAEKILPTQIDKLVYDSSSDLLNQDVKAFLQKPVVILAGTLNTTDTVSTFPGAFMPFAGLQNQIYARKLDGYLGIRATMVFRLVVNANRFQQGRYIMSYLPLGGADATAGRTTTWANDHQSTLVQRTTLPHVELDLCCDTEATIRIPFNSSLNWYPITATAAPGNTYGSWGILYLNPYVALTAATGNLTAGYTLYMHFEDIQLISAAVPQSGRLNFSKKSRKSDTEVEQDSIGVGPISSALIKVRDASSILSNIPLLSSYASGVSWFADIGASAAKVFGWSKPVVLAPSTRVTQNYLPYFANTDGPDESFPLSLSYENSVGIANGFSGTDVDEMSFQFLSTIPVWNTTVTWTIAATHPADTLLLLRTVSPATDIFTTIVNTATFNHFSPLQLIAQHFNYWRGSIVYKFKFVKTEFHSGRLSVTFNPNNPNIVGSTTPTLGDSPYIHRQIIDIREANEFTFVVPFISDSPYKLCSNSSESSTGVFSIRVLDPLVAPATVSQTVQIIVEKSSGPDIEFAVPQQCLQNYYSGIVPQSGNVFGSVDQGSTVCSNLNTTIGSALVQADNSLNALHCIGEKISSFRALLKLPHQLVFVVAPTAAAYLNVIPYAFNTGNVSGAVNTAPAISSDLYARLASCYVYSRGGVRLKFVDNAAVTIPTPLSVWFDSRTPTSATLRTNGVQWAAANSGGSANATDRNNMPTLFYRAGYSGEIQVPQYHRFHSRLNSDCYNNLNTQYVAQGTSLAPRVFVTRSSLPSATVDTAIYRSISDDGNFGSFISVPPMLAVTVVQP